MQGIAFCEYANEELTAVALEGLNGMEIGDSVLKVQKACVGFQQASGLEMGVNAMSMLAGTTSTDLEHGRVLQLLNMVTPEELLDNEEYEGKQHISSTCLVRSADLHMQKLSQMSAKNARNTAKYSTSRFPVQAVQAAKPMAWARFSSSLKTRRRQRRPSLLWRGGNSPIGPSW